MTVLDAIATPQTAPEVLSAIRLWRNDDYFAERDGQPLILDDVRAILDMHVDEGRAELAGVRGGEQVYVAMEAAK